VLGLNFSVSQYSTYEKKLFVGQLNQKGEKVMAKKKVAKKKVAKKATKKTAKKKTAKKAKKK